MEICNGNDVDENQFRNEEAEEQISNSRSMNERLSHVNPRHRSYGSEKEETGLSFNYNTDSQAEDSVYRYVEKIKSFLGWERYREESECADKAGGSTGRKTEDSSSGANYLEASLKSNEKAKKPTEDQESCDIVVSSDSANEYLDSDISLLVSDSLLDNASEIGDSEATKLSLLSGSGCNYDTENDTLAYDNNSERTVFTSEITIHVANYRSEVSYSETELNDLTPDTIKQPEMNQCLVKDNNLDLGLVINDASDILQMELSPSSITENNYEGDCKENGKVNKNITPYLNKSDTSDKNEFLEYDKMTTGELKVRNVTNGENISDGGIQQTLDSSPNTCLNEPNAVESYQNMLEELGNKKTLDCNGSIEGNESQEGELPKEITSQTLKPVVANVGKNVMDPSTNASETKRSAMTCYTVKASVHYEKEMKKKEKTKGDASGKIKNIGQKEILYDDDTSCGFGCFRPKWLQPFATPRMYVVLYSLLGILHGSYYSYLIGSLSTLEKRFAFRTKISGAIMVADEVTPLLLGVIIGYIAGRSNRPRMIAIGMLLSAGCCFFSSFPYFVYGPVQHLLIQGVENNHTGPAYCDANTDQGSCDSDERPPTIPAVLFLVVGSFLKGFGNLAYYAIGLAYLDDNSDKKTTPIYLAVALALRLLGPLVGFIMSSAFLKFYENPFDDPGFGPEDPRWIGAWWMGFFLQGVLLLIFTLPIALFPRRLPNCVCGSMGDPKHYLFHCRLTEQFIKNLFQNLYSFPGQEIRLWSEISMASQNTPE